MAVEEIALVKMASKLFRASARSMQCQLRNSTFLKNTNILSCTLCTGNGKTKNISKNHIQRNSKNRNDLLSRNTVKFLSNQNSDIASNETTGMENITSAYNDHLKRDKMVDKNSIDDKVRTGDFFERILSRFPLRNRSFSFAYGSGVFHQVGHSPPKGNMTDIILAVNDPLEWHQENIERNPSDYAGLMRVSGARVVTEMQCKWGSRLYFNTLIPFEDGKIKYGVISRSDLITDLLDWENLYSAGRLQKPVKILERPTKKDDPDLQLALRMNLASSIHTALLLLPDRFSEEKFYNTIAGLSYAGDFRMFVGGEDKNKVSNIVQANIPHFRTLYAKQLQNMSQFVNFSPDLSEVEQDVSPAGRHHHLTMLPKNLQGWLVSVWNEDGRYRDVEDVLRAAAFERDSGDLLSNCLQKVVWTPSITQALKGLITAGISKSVVYGVAKLKKGLKSKQIATSSDVS